jgi:5'-nucleotidase/UDP-sugar diphosphatase
LENGASQMETGAGRFLQVSGLRYTVDPSRAVGSRVSKVEVLDAEGAYQPLNPTEIYTVATNDFMRGGGDGYTVMAEKGMEVYDFGRPLDQVLADYMKANEPVKIGIEDRITVIK